MARPKVTLSRAGMRQVLTSGAVRAELTARAGRVLGQARATIAVDTGAARDSLHLRQDTTDRAVTRVVLGVPYGHVLEANTGVLSRSLDAAGGT